MKSFLMVLGMIWVGRISAQDSLSIMYYNLLNFPGSTSNRADTLRVILDQAKPDLFLANELQSEAGADLILSTALPAAFKRAPFTDGPDTDNMLFYNAEKLTLYQTDVIKTSLRHINKYVVYYNEIVDGDTSFITLFSAHLKASSGTENETAREAECSLFIDYIQKTPSRGHELIGGDFNFYDSDEPGFQKLMTHFNDPANKVGAWHDNITYTSVFTQSTRTLAFGGGATGGMDDRFDFILVSDDLLEDRDVTLLKGSYRVFGQDGNRFNKSMISPYQNASVPLQVASALYSMSDHLPVMLSLLVPSTEEGLGQTTDERTFYRLTPDGLDLMLEENSLVTFYDLLGHQVWQQSYVAGNHHITLPSKGYYLGHIIGSEGHISFKFMLTH